ncbi:MAG: hypothetical protein NTW20_10705 [Rhodobacterales bacterium]|nr:hypothetical protein [Rhodobacterales bacterium]
MHRVARALMALSFVAACDPADLADSAMKRAASSVVFPVVNLDMPAREAQSATDCILNAASADELRLLARDVGVEAGSSTKATIRTIALRPDAQTCFAARGVPPIR